MNILLINHYAGSPEMGMEFRPYYLGREWVRQGHRVMIVGGSFSHLRKKQPIKAFEEVDGIAYSWVKLNRYKGNGVRRIFSMFSFVSKLWMSPKKYLRGFKPDVVIASSTYPLDIFPAHKIANLYHAKLVYEVHDLWPLSPQLIGKYSKWHPFIFTMQVAENYAYKHVDKVVSLLWNAEQHMRGHGLKDGKFVCIPNGYSQDDWKFSEKQELLSERHRHLFERLKDRIIVGFAGGLVASGALNTLVNAAELLRADSRFVFILVGKGAEQNDLENLVQVKGLNNVFFLPEVKKTQVPQVVSYFDIAYMGGVHSILHSYGTSYNKLTDYMLSAKPIVFAIDEPNALVERIECGIRVEAENAEQVAETILSIAKMSIEERQKMGERGKEYALKHLEWGMLAQQFVEQLN